MAERALNESRRYREQVAPKVAAANEDMGQRMKAAGMEIEYVPDEDHLYVTIGSPRSSEAIPLGDGTRAVLLVDPETYEITGFEAPFFMEDLQRLQDQPEFFRLVADMIRRGGNHIYVPPAAEAEKAEEAMRALIPSGT
jgi:hypothetical protein